MGNFVKRNLAWIAIFLCVVGVILSIVGIPTQQPLFFFIGIIFALPTIGYLVYQVFFYKGQPEPIVKAEKNKNLTGNMTAILDKREDIILNNDTNADLEPLYNGYATEEEIEHQLSDIVNQEREKAIQATPANVIIAEDATVMDEDAIRAATQGELLRQRQIELDDIMDPTIESEPEPEPEPEPQADTTTPMAEELLVQEANQATDIIKETPIEEAAIPEPIQELQAVTPEQVTEPEPESEPESEPASAPEPEPQPKSNKITIIKEIDPEELAKRTEQRKQKAAEKKALLSQENLERYLQHYFLEIATCFVLNRNIYKDNRGIAPYNKLNTSKDDGLPEYTISATKGRLYKFCTYLVDMERFITHPELYEDFITAVEKGIPLGRVSETLHALYRKKYKKDFVLNLANREDWDNIIILVFNNYILDNDNFKDVFTRVPFEIPEAFNEQNVTDYLSDPEIQERFLEKFPSFTEIGIPTVWEALYICFINSIKTKLPVEQLETAILKEHKKIARALKRADSQRQKMLRKAS